MKDLDVKALLDLHKENKKLTTVCAIGGCVMVAVAGIFIYRIVKEKREIEGFLDADEFEDDEDELEIIDLDIDSED